MSIVREKELLFRSSITTSRRAGRLEYLLGKQLPYLLIAMINFFILVTLALIVFGVPIKGSFLLDALHADLRIYQSLNTRCIQNYSVP